MTHLCRRLRWKGRHGADAVSPEWVEAAYARNEVPWTCLSTGQPWGPDESVVDPHGCNPSRGCFIPDPALRSPIS